MNVREVQEVSEVQETHTDKDNQSNSKSGRIDNSTTKTNRIENQNTKSKQNQSVISSHQEVQLPETGVNTALNGVYLETGGLVLVTCVLMFYLKKRRG